MYPALIVICLILLIRLMFTNYPNVYSLHTIMLFLQYKSILMIDFSNVDKQVSFKFGIVIYEQLLLKA